MRKTYCSVCGKMMNEKSDENSGKPFKIQMCSVSCINEAWHNVTEALKKGVRPEWVYICNGEQPQPQSRSNNKRYIYHNRIVFLQNQMNKTKLKNSIVAIDTSNREYNIIRNSWKQSIQRMKQNDRRKNGGINK